MANDHLLVTKMTPPVVRTELMPRPRLYDLLDRGAHGKLTLVDAPAGWGKTTLVGSWLARRETTTAAWLSLDPDDDDPVRFWLYVIEAIRTAGIDIGAPAVELLHAPGTTPLTGAVPVIVNELAGLTTPLVVVLDDYHVITDQAVHDGVSFLIERLPPTVHVVLVTRSDPPFPLARWRVRGEVVDVRADDLRFDADDTATLFNLLGVDLTAGSLARLHERTEGWVAGLYLAALSLQRHHDPDAFVAGFAGDDRHIVDYLGSEVLDALPDTLRSFMVETSILERLTGPLCDAVTTSEASAARLADIERANHFLVPLDTHRNWYRYHQLFAELLRLELDRRHADVTVLHRRAAKWLLDHGLVADAVRHTTLAGDTQLAADLIAEYWSSFLQHGELAAVTGWLDALGDQAVRADPRLCLVRAWISINVGRVDDLPGWIDAAATAAKPWPTPDGLAFSAAAAMLGCIEKYLTGDAAAAITAANQALALGAAEAAPWRSVGCPVLGIAQFWSGRTEQSAATLDDAVPRAAQADNHLAVMHALGCLALAAAERGDYTAAAELAERSNTVRDNHTLGDHWAAAMTHLATAKALLHKGDMNGADHHHARAVELSRNGLARIELAYGLLSLADLRLRQGRRADAARLDTEAQDALARCPDPGVVNELAAHVAQRLDRGIVRAPRPLAEGEQLTAREFAVLALLPSDLTLRQLASTLYVSLNTVKTQTRAIYRKLGVTNRAEAVTRARQIGLTQPHESVEGRRRPGHPLRRTRERLKALDDVEGSRTDGQPWVLFLCVHNAGRSQMAAGWLRHLAGDRVHVSSGGSEPASQVNPAAIDAMSEVGIDIRGEFPKPWTDEIVRAADVVVTMGCGDACPLYPGKRYEDWELDDSAGLGVAAVRPIRDVIRQRVEHLMTELGVAARN